MMLMLPRLSKSDLEASGLMWGCSTSGLIRFGLMLRLDCSKFDCLRFGSLMSVSLMGMSLVSVSLGLVNLARNNSIGLAG